MGKKEQPLPKHLTPDGMRSAQTMKNKAIHAWASDRGLGSQPPSIAEVSRAPSKSTKNIKRSAA